MLNIYKVQSKKQLNEFINSNMNNSPNWTVTQHDTSTYVFPMEFTLVLEPQIKLAHVHQLVRV